jgi:hypothetical protein
MVDRKVKHRIEPVIPQFNEGLETLGNGFIRVTEAKNKVFTELWVTSNIGHTVIQRTAYLKLTDEELTELRDMCTRALRTRRRRSSRS